MANKTVIIATIKDSEKWINITDNEGVEYGIYKEKAPKLTALMANLKVGNEITGNHSTKDNKNFLWDIDDSKKGGSGKSFAPADRSFTAAQTAITAAASMYSLEKDKDVVKILNAAESFHAFLMSKISKPTESK